ADSAKNQTGSSNIPYEQYVAMNKDPGSVDYRQMEQLNCKKCDSTTQKRIERGIKRLKDLEKYAEAYDKRKDTYDKLRVRQLADSLQIADFSGKYYDKNKSIKENIPGAVDRLPNGRLKKWVSKLTGFDAGMLSSYHSDYTLAGQMTQGVDAGY